MCCVHHPDTHAQVGARLVAAERQGLYHCTTILYYTILLYYYTTALLHYCTTALLHYCRWELVSSLQSAKDFEPALAAFRATANGAA